jgi:hypothetical protein
MQNALSPSEYDVVQTVFDALSRAEWFDRNHDNEKACARLVLLQYGDGGLDAEELRARCEHIARERFSARQ